MNRLGHRFRHWLHQWQKSLRAPPTTIPPALWLSVIRRLGFLSRLPEDQLSRLKRVSEQLLDRIPLIGAQRLEITDEMAVLISVQAALPVLNLNLDLYDDLSAIVVYPGAFSVRQQQVDEAGVVHEWQETLAGEAVGQGGAVVLSWDDLAWQQASGGTHNIVIHEFAHKIDMARGEANGFPPFLVGLHDREALSGWAAVFSDAYADFCARVDALENHMPSDLDDADPVPGASHDELLTSLPLDPYATRDAAEFFAVASEAFFTSPAPLDAAYPRVYALLSAYYRQDPLNAG